LSTWKPSTGWNPSSKTTGFLKFMEEADEDETLFCSRSKKTLPHGRNLIITAAKIVRITIMGKGMVTKNTSVTVEKKEPSPRGEGLNQTERSILIQSTERHDKALKKLSKL
jgi:hypothetical protein